MHNYAKYMFANAIVRKPGPNFSEGITDSDLGRPDYKKALEQHEAYCKALEKCGLKLTALKPSLKYPDAEFVEDSAVLTERCAIISRLAEKPRQGEEASIRKALSKKFSAIEQITSGFIEGGDVMRVGNHFYIGLSRRTNQEGAMQLITALAKYGYSASTIPTKTVFHLKTGITYIGNNTVVCIEEFAHAKEFDKFNIIVVDKDEEYAANCLLVNDFLLMPKGYPKTKKKIDALRHNVLEIPMSEFKKMNGGLTCLSLIY